MSEDSLTDFIEHFDGKSHLRVESDLGDGFVRLRSAEAERRQAAHDIRSTEDIVIEMLRNARDAGARHIFVSCTRESRYRRIVMLDDGFGVPQSMHELIFEPRVTSKLDSMCMDKWGVHGRGMALYSIKVNALDARVVTSVPEGGSSFFVETNLDSLGEKTDQSTFPTFEEIAPGHMVMRGPKNILRTACEFALEAREACNVYLGSSTEIAATLYVYGVASSSVAVRAFCKDINDIAVCKRMATCGDPASFAKVAESLGLEISERSARRILDGEIKPLDSLLDCLAAMKVFASPKEKASSKTKSHLTLSDARGLKIDKSDLSSFSACVADAYKNLAERYYLTSEVSPEIRVERNALKITIPFEKLP